MTVVDSTADAAEPAAADAALPDPAGAASAATTTYELLQRRLADVAGRLRTSADRLNSQRAEAFAPVPLVLAEQDRTHTEAPCLPRDAIGIGELLLFGTNAPPGLARQRQLGELFHLFRVARVSERDWEFTPVGPEEPDNFLADASFRRDMGELLTYYSDTRLIRLVLTEGELLMVMGIGTADSDIRVLRWRRSGRSLTYVDAFGEDDLGGNHRFDFTWSDAGRESMAEGRWPHVAVAGTLFVGIDRGELDYRIDDAVTDGRTILREKLTEVGQDVGELRIRYARLGELLALRVLPYRESDERFYLYNRLTRTLHRVDALGRGCHQLPEAQGVVFPGGFHLQNGETRVFATDATGYELVGSHRSPNGEDFLYVYHRPHDGQYLLLAYNLVARTMEVPLGCCGYALFEDGTLVLVRDVPEPQRVHTVAVYTSPFCIPDRYAPPVASDSFFGRVGNTDLVHALGECLSIARDAEAPEFNAAVFEALVARTTRVVDTNAWLSQPDAGDLGALLVQLRKAAGSVLDEFAAVAASRRDAAHQVGDAERAVVDFVTTVGLGVADAQGFIARLAEARALLGRLAALSEVREVDRAAVGDLTGRVQTAFDGLGAQTLDFLGDPAALDPMRAELDQAEADGLAAPTAAAVGEVVARVEETGGRAVLLTDVVGGLDVADVTSKTAVLTTLSELLARRNAVRATLDGRARTLRETESAAGFAAALAVLSQRSTASLLAAPDAAAVDGALTELQAELENLELRYGDVAAHAEALDVKRGELAEAFGRRRDQLAGEKARRIDGLVASARRVLATVTERAGALADRAAVDTFFATDPLVTRVRRTLEELRTVGEAGRAGELEVALGAARDQARRTATDRAELFDAGTVKVGRHRFGVNAEAFALRLDATPEAGFAVRLSGTDLVVPIDDAELAEFADLATQSHPAETPELPRALFLALEAHRLGVIEAAGVTKMATERLEDGYELGVHDADAAAILAAIRPVLEAPGLRYDGPVRAVAATWLSSANASTGAYPAAIPPGSVAPHAGSAGTVAGAGSPGYQMVSAASVARELAALRALGGRDGQARAAFVAAHGPALAALAADAGLAVDVEVAVDALVEGHFPATADPGPLVDWAHAASLDLRASTFAERVRWAADLGAPDPAQVAWLAVDRASAATVQPVVEVTGLRSLHPRIVSGVLTVDVPAAATAFATYRRRGVPRFARFSAARRSVLTRWRDELGVDGLRPKVLSSFVRNRLVDDVLLPLAGENLARQLGLNGAAQGLLLLVSPPGYGKTTLVEYLADLLGFALVKVSGPALGHHVTSLDPGVAPDRTAAAELLRLNRAFAMGSNVVCYLDDIQHTNPEFLQRFIPLGDGTRRIEGVLDGRPTTFELAGKRFVMVMAGNPYTSGGGQFRIPDMLANRADVHNLGDIVAGHQDAFAQSYLENAAGVNETLAPVLARGRTELDVILRAVAAGGSPTADQLSGSYSPAELGNAVRVVQHLGQVRDVLLKVNAAYIASAATDEAMRGEPPFLLQGSYRNLARIASRVVPAMTSGEVTAVVADHYRSEAQTLATAATWNLAKLREVTGWASETELEHLDELRYRWREANVGSDPLTAMATALRGIESYFAGDQPGDHAAR